MNYQPYRTAKPDAEAVERTRSMMENPRFGQKKDVTLSAVVAKATEMESDYRYLSANFPVGHIFDYLGAKAQVVSTGRLEDSFGRGVRANIPKLRGNVTVIETIELTVPMLRRLHGEEV